MDFTGDLKDEHLKEMHKHDHYTQDNIADHYNELADNYEGVYLRAGWTDPFKCADLAAEALGDKKCEAQILDMGCGTGLVGQRLAELGCKNVIGVDASKNMLEKA